MARLVLGSLLLAWAGILIPLHVLMLLGVINNTPNGPSPWGVIAANSFLIAAPGAWLIVSGMRARRTRPEREEGPSATAVSEQCRRWKAVMQKSSHEDVPAQLQAVVELEALGSTQAAEVLMEKFNGYNEPLCRAVADALARMGGPAIPPLLAWLGGTYGDNGPSAAAVLGRMRDPQVVPALREAFRAGPDLVRERAALALTFHNEGIATVADWWRRSEEPFRSRLARVLYSRDWAPREPRERAQLFCQVEHWDKAAAVGGAAIDFLAAALGRTDGNTAEYVTTALSQITDPQVVPVLREQVELARRVLEKDPNSGDGLKAARRLLAASRSKFNLVGIDLLTTISQLPDVSSTRRTERGIPRSGPMERDWVGVEYVTEEETVCDSRADVRKQAQEEIARLKGDHANLKVLPQRFRSRPNLSS